MGNCTCWHVRKLVERLRKKWSRSQLRTTPCRQTPQGGFGPCEERGSFDSAFLGWKFKIKSAQQWAFLLLPPITTNSFLPSHKLGWRIPLQSWRWWKTPGCPRPTVTNVPRSPQNSAVMRSSPLSWGSVVFCMLGHTEGKVKHAAFVLKRAFPSCTK